MSEAPLVSIIIPAHNAGAYIGDTLASVLAQTYAELEILVVDDGSTDDTAEIVRSYAARDRRIVLLSQPNLGVASARNLAIASAKGEYIAPLDADDIWLPEKIERQVREFSRVEGSVGLVYSWWIRIDDDGRLDTFSPPYRLKGDVYKALVFSNFVGNASVPLIRKAVIDRVGGYDTSLRDHGAQGCEDWDLYLRIGAEYDFAVTPAYLVGYRDVPRSMSYSCTTMYRSFERVLSRVKSQHPELPSSLFRWSQSNFMQYLCGKCYRTGAYGEATYWILRTLTIDPAALSSPLLTRSLFRMVFQGQRSTDSGRKQPFLLDSPPDTISDELHAMRSRKNRRKWNLYRRVARKRWKIVKRWLAESDSRRVRSAAARIERQPDYQT